MRQPSVEKELGSRSKLGKRRVWTMHPLSGPPILARAGPAIS